VKSGLLIASGLLIVATGQPCSVSLIRQIWSKQPGSQSKLFAFERDGRVGFIDSKGKIIIKPAIPGPIDRVGDFVNGLAHIGDGDYIDETGSAADPPEPGLAVYEAVRSLLHTPKELWGRQFPLLKGFIEGTGKIVIPPTFADVGPFQGGLARATIDGYCHVARADGWAVASPTSGSNDSCGAAPADAILPCRVGFIDRTGRFAIQPAFESAHDFEEGLAAVRIEGRWGFTDTTGRIVIPRSSSRLT
jgi:hypothetical protein